MKKINIDLKAIASHFGEYEARVKEVVHELDLKSRDARKKSKQRIDEFTSHLKKTREELETKVSALVHTEGQKLNAHVADVLKYLKSVAGSEKMTETPVVTATKKAASKSEKTSTKKSSAKKKGSRKAGVAARSPKETLRDAPTNLA